MPDLATITPARRPELVFRPMGDDGRYVVKVPHTGAFYNLGEQESFLLLKLDGMQSPAAISAAFQERFGQQLTDDDLNEFLEMAQELDLLRPAGASGEASADGASGRVDRGDREPVAQQRSTDDDRHRPRVRRPVNLLAWRISLFDPDRLFDWLAPKLRFAWTGTFLALSAGCILAAAIVAWTNRHEMASSFAHALRWETLVLAWLTLLAVTTCHEFAHGLTCKRHGGEVHEVGFLLMFLMPCLYCNVSDAWLIREKSKRLWVTLAGGYCDLIIWALAVFVWRLALQDSMLNYLAWVVLSVCGVRTFMNFNPFLKLDGYYLLSDLIGIPNLRRRAMETLMGHLRWLLWGAARPDREPHGRLLLGYGITSWLFSLSFLSLMFVSTIRLLGPGWKLAGLGLAALLGTIILRGLFRGFFGGEVMKMLLMRRRRSTIWLLIGGTLPAVMALGQMEHVTKGSFQVRPSARAELRAPVAGFLQAVYQVEGDRISPGTPIARLEIPDLASRIAQKDAEVREARAKLRLLTEGARREEVVQQRRRVERAQAWRDLARKDLARAQQGLRDDLARLEAQVAQHRAEHEHAEDTLARCKALLNRRTIAIEQYRQAENQCRVAQAQAKQAEAQHRARRAEGTVAAEAELARRDQALAEAQGALTLLEAGSRPEEVEAARAYLSKLEVEASYLEGLREKLQIYSPVPGLITTPRLREKIGQYLREGDLICEVKGSSVLEAEVALAEQDVARVRPGRTIELKARSLPFHTFHTRVDRVAPIAAHDEKSTQSTVTVYCRLEDSAIVLRPGMTGYARIACGRRPIGEILFERIQGLLRTEFWW